MGSASHVPMYQPPARVWADIQDWQNVESSRFWCSWGPGSAKHPRIEGENEYDGESLSDGDTSRADDDPTLSGGDASSRAYDDPANSAGLVSQLQHEVTTLVRENNKLEAENNSSRRHMSSLCIWSG